MQSDRTIDDLRAENAELREVLSRVQWSSTLEIEDGDTCAVCPWCDAPKVDGGHLRNCRLAAALREGEQ